MAISYFDGRRGLIGVLMRITGADGNTRAGVAEAVTLVDSSGNPAVTGSGTSNVATSQAASSVSPAAATQIVAARSGRASVTITNITGTQPTYLGPSGVTTATGLFLAGAAGASVTISTAAAIFGTSPTAAQTLSVLESY